jgi:hypothetical protein
VTEVRLQRAGVVASIGERMARRVARHVRMAGKGMPARSPMRPNSVLKPLAVIGPPRSERLAERSWLSLRYSRRMVPSVDVRPRRSIAPVLKKVFVDLLTIAQPLGLRRREEWLLPAEWLSDRHPLFRNGHSRQNSNHRSDFDRGRPMIRHDRSIHGDAIPGSDARLVATLRM